MNVSRAGAGMYATVVMVLLNLIGIDVDEGMVTEAVLAVMTMVSFGVWLYGQLMREDLKLGLWRKS